MGKRKTIDAIVVDKYTKRVMPSFQTHDKTIRIRYAGKKMNFQARFDRLEEFLDKSLHSLVKDFYKIALTVFIADCNFKRRDKQPNRTIRILTSVSDLALWNSHKQKLEGLLYTLSGDNIVFNFVQGKSSKRKFKFPTKESEWVVSLFSGGIDSLAGVAWLKENDIKSILVTHSSPQTKISHIQKTLADKLVSIFSENLEFYQINAVPVGTDLKNKESSQRLRSFLYLTIGSVFALTKGIKRLNMFENGIMALNIPISNSRIFLNTRTAYPVFLDMYADFVETMFATKFEVLNPFQEKTKTEVAILLKAKEFSPLIKNTISCSKLLSLIMSGVAVSKTWHCGVCLPCIIRRISLSKASLSRFDASYATDILGDFDKIDPYGRRVILELLDFSKKLSSCRTVEEVLETFPAFFIENTDPLRLVGMYKRHVKEVRDFFSSSKKLTNLL